MSIDFKFPTLTPVSRNSSFTAVPGNFYTIVLSGGDVVCTLPPAANWPGLYIGIRVVTPSAVSVVIIDGDGVETVDGLLIYPLVVDEESVLLTSNGSENFIVAGKRKAIAEVERAAAQAVDTATTTRIELDTVRLDNANMGEVGTHAITAVDTGANTFTVAGNVTPFFPAGKRFRVVGSTANDDHYTVVSSVFGTSTVITTSAIPDNTADGTITLQGIHIPRDGNYAIYVQGQNFDGIDQGEFTEMYAFINDPNLSFPGQVYCFMYAPIDNRGDFINAKISFALSRFDFIELGVAHNEGSTLNTRTGATARPFLSVLEL